MLGVDVEVRHLPPMRPEEAVERLGAMPDGASAEEAEFFHREADHLLLRVLRHIGQEAVVMAFLQARKRAGFRYA